MIVYVKELWIMNALVMDVAPHVWPEGTAPVLVNLVKLAPADNALYRGCMDCGGEPLYRVTWDTPGAWWGDTHRGRFCHACVTGRGIREGWVRPALVICTAHTVGQARSAVTPGNAPRRAAIQRERMRLSRRRFDRGLAGDFRPSREGGARRLLLLVAPGPGEQMFCLPLV